MAQTYEFYAERAAAATAAADKAQLANVREREMRAAKTWTDLANQARRVTLQREKTEREKAAARVAAEAGED
ncbi:hypothetical protein [Pseudoblastomonas halimionae]|uniref:Uncharacterized protein n=1 Tax=Alteriqipengyuania halimionae TaxID=1926630 RepID=A0A6I4TY56_9SPHN|nr:hypothetical protein [Alteriqipengyuania halimionae]MXP08580.1 hypothetical protein [Alteriqipengyuania halimionae]